MSYSQKVAIVSGVTGQDGSFLVELLLEKGYHRVIGLIRHTSLSHLNRIPPYVLTHASFVLKEIDMTDSVSINLLLSNIKTEYFTKNSLTTLEIYNLAAQSHVHTSFRLPEYTTNVDALGVLRFLEAIRQNNLISVARFYQAGTSELFGKVAEVPQKETTPFYPRSPYGVSKLYAYWITKNYRESYNMYCCNGILFNHESERRGDNFVTRKITKSVYAVLSGQEDCIQLGNLDAQRDWGYAKEYVYGMWLMLQQDQPDDYVLCTGQCHSVRDFVEECLRFIGVDIVWEGTGIDEVGRDKTTGKVWVRINPEYYRPAEVDLLIGDNTKAREKLGWSPKVSFQELVKIMMTTDNIAL
jgi:GDPmannose 4,6-dehydratase